MMHFNHLMLKYRRAALLWDDHNEKFDGGAEGRRRRRHLRHGDRRQHCVADGLCKVDHSFNIWRYRGVSGSPSTQTTWNSSCLPSHSMTIRKRTLNNNGININFFITFFSKQVLFLTNSSAPPDSQIKKAKIRDYNISISYLRRVIFTIHKTFFDAF